MKAKNLPSSMGGTPKLVFMYVLSNMFYKGGRLIDGGLPRSRLACLAQLSLKNLSLGLRLKCVILINFSQSIELLSIIFMNGGPVSEIFFFVELFHIIVFFLSSTYLMLLTYLLISIVWVGASWFWRDVLDVIYTCKTPIWEVSLRRSFMASTSMKTLKSTYLIIAC